MTTKLQLKSWRDRGIPGAAVPSIQDEPWMWIQWAREWLIVIMFGGNPFDPIERPKTCVLSRLIKMGEDDQFIYFCCHCCDCCGRTSFGVRKIRGRDQRLQTKVLPIARASVYYFATKLQNWYRKCKRQHHAAIIIQKKFYGVHIQYLPGNKAFRAAQKRFEELISVCNPTHPS